MNTLAMGVMQDAYSDWKCIPKAEQTWTCWKKCFNDMFNELKEFNAITAESMGYGANHITENMVTADVAMVQDNLASTAISNTDAIDTLAATNKQLAKALANVMKENERLLSMMNQLTNKATKPKP